MCDGVHGGVHVFEQRGKTLKERRLARCPFGQRGGQRDKSTVSKRVDSVGRLDTVKPGQSQSMLATQAGRSRSTPRAVASSPAHAAETRPGGVRVGGLVFFWSRLKQRAPKNVINISSGIRKRPWKARGASD